MGLQPADFAGSFCQFVCMIRLRAINDALRLHLGHDDPTQYNAVQRVLYIGVILIVVLIVLSGLALWKPVQFSEFASLFYDFQTTRLIHFLCMTAIVLFLVVHVAPASLVPQNLYGRG
jgi:thiosulfate reductase cytochrome b subunit